MRSGPGVWLAKYRSKGIASAAANVRRSWENDPASGPSISSVGLRASPARRSRPISPCQSGLGSQQRPVRRMGIDQGEAKIPPNVVAVAMAVAHYTGCGHLRGHPGRQVLFPLSGVPEDGQPIPLYQGAVNPIVLLPVPDPRLDLPSIHRVIRFTPAAGLPPRRRAFR